MTKVYILNDNADVYGLVTQIASQKYNIPVCALKIAKGEKGKPFFENLTNFHFNVSHSGKIKVLAVSQNNVGIDVEKIREIPLKIAKKFCQSERDYIAEADSLKRFFEIWTKKEAYLKYSGTGISGGLNSFDTLKPTVPLKTFGFEEYLISVCGNDDFTVIDMR